jgi:hypothetical protein
MAKMKNLMMKKESSDKEGQQEEKKAVVEQPVVVPMGNHYEKLFIDLVDTIYSTLSIHLGKIYTILTGKQNEYSLE